MEIKPNNSLGQDAAGIGPTARRPRRARRRVGRSAGSLALRGLLDETADIRPEAVARGRTLVGSEQYPFKDTLRRLAGLLAAEFRGRPAPGGSGKCADGTSGSSPPSRD